MTRQQLRHLETAPLSEILRTHGVKAPMGRYTASQRAGASAYQYGVRAAIAGRKLPTAWNWTQDASERQRLRACYDAGQKAWTNAQ